MLHYEDFSFAAKQIFEILAKYKVTKVEKVDKEKFKNEYSKYVAIITDYIANKKFRTKVAIALPAEEHVYIFWIEPQR